MNGRTTLIILVLAMAIGPAMAQSLNIDLGHPEAGAPPDGYRAAGLPGVWQKFEATEWGVFHDLVDVYGQPIVARVRQIGGTEIVATPLGGAGEPNGSNATLLGDALVTHAIENCLFFESLENGTYEVLSYTWMPTAPTTLNHVWIDFHPYEPEIGGAWPGQLEETIVYARHEFTVVDGVINMHSGIPDGDPPNPGAALNGIQLRLMGPEPPLFVTRTAIEWLTSLDASRYDVVRGDLGTLVATSGDFTAAVEACIADNSADTSLPWSTDPDPGEGHFFVARGVTLLGGFTWNAPGDSQVGDRDAEINASAGACP